MGNTVPRKKNQLTINNDEIDSLLKQTHFNKAELLEWHNGFIVRKF